MSDIAELGFKLDTRDLLSGRRALDDLTGSSDKAGMSLKHFIAIGAGMAALKAGSDVIREFSREVATLGAISDATSSQMAEMRAQAIALGGATAYSAAEAATAQKNLAAAGLNVSEVLKATPVAMRLAQAGAIGLADASDLLANTMGQTGGSIVDMTRYADVFVKTANISTTSVAALGQSMKYAAPISTALGLSIEETSAALAVLAQNGLKGEQGGTSFRSGIMKIMDVSKEAEGILASYGVKVSQLDVQQRGLVPVLETLRKANLSASDSMKIFGAESFAGVKALMGNIETLKDYTGQLDAASGSAKKAADAMSNNLDAAFKSVGSSIESLIIRMSDATGFEEWAKSALGSVAGVVGSFSGVNDQLVASGDMSKEAAAGFDTMRMSIEGVAVALAAAGIGVGVATLPAAITAVTASLGGATAGAYAFAAALAANPIGLAVGAVATLVGGLYVLRDVELEIGGVTARVSDWILGAWESAKRGVLASVNAMSSAVGALGDAFVGIATGNFGAAGAAMSKWADNAVAGFKNVGSAADNAKRITATASAAASSALQSQNAALLRSTDNALAVSAKAKDKIASDFKAQMAARAAAQKALDAAGGKKKSGGGGKSETDKEADALERILGINNQYTKSLGILYSAYSKGKIGLETYRGAVEKLIFSETEQGKAAKKAAEDRDREIRSIEETAARLAEQVELYGMSEEQISRYVLAKAESQLATAKESGAIDSVVDALQREVDARKKVADETGKLSRKRAATEEAKSAADEWRRASQDIEKALTDSLMRGFESGQSFGDSLVDYVKNAFESAAIKVILSPVMGSINAVGQQLMTGGAAGLPSIGGIFDAFTSGSDAFSSGIDSALKSNLGQSLGFSATQQVAYTDAWAAGSSMTMTDTSLTSLGESAKVAGEALGYLPTAISAVNGEWGRAAGAAAGQYIGGPLGAMLGSELGGMLDSTFGGGGPDQRTAKFGMGASDALTAEGVMTGWTGSSIFGQFRTYADKWFSDSEMRPAMSAFIDTLETMDATIASTLGVGSDQAQSVKDALSKIDKEYDFGTQWTDFTQSSKAREQIAIDRYSTILDGIKSGWGEFVTGFSGSFDQFPQYLESILAAMQKFDGGMAEVFNQNIETIGQFKALARGSETAAMAFKRLYSTFSVTNAALVAMGHDAGLAGLETANLRQQFADAAGGADSLASIVDGYLGAAFSDAERQALKLEQLNKQFMALGVSMPSNVTALRELVKAQDLSTAAGQKLALQLMQIAPTLADVTGSAAGSAVSIETLRNGVQEAYNRESDAIRTTIDRLKQFSTQVGLFRDSLYLNKELSPLSVLGRYQFAGAKVEELQAKALAGDQDAQAQFEQYATEFLTYSRDYNANNAQYVADFDRIQAILSQMKGGADSQISAAQAQLSRLDAMVSGIIDVKTAIMSLADAVAAFAAGGQIKPVVKKPTGVTITDGMATSSITGQSATAGAIQDYITQQTNAGDFQSIYNAATSQGLTSGQLADIAQGAGYNVSSTDINAWAASQGLPSFDVGTNSVPSDTLAIVHQGERIIPKADNNRLIAALEGNYSSYGNSSAEPLLAEIKALREEVKALRGQQAQEHSNDLRQREAIATAQIEVVANQATEMQRMTAKGI